MVKITVPATTANLGPGFDCIGAALTLYNRFEFTPADTLQIDVRGEGQELVSRGTDNLVYQSFCYLYAELGQTPPPIHLEIKMGIPLARGLGSSATAIVGGLMGANHLAGQPLNTSGLIDLATQIEGHPDNVVPALLGGCHLAAKNGDDWHIGNISWYPSLIPVVAIPNFTLSTEVARSVLPATVSRQDAISNIARFGLLLRGLETGCEDWLRVGLQDSIHQPYRQTLIKGYEAVHTAAMAAGAYGMVISGAGPTVLAITHADEANAVATSMESTWRRLGIEPQIHILSMDTAGARSLI